MMQAVLDEFQPGRTINLPGASGEALALAGALQTEPAQARGVHLVSCLIPGMNRFDYAALSDSVTLTAFMLPPGCQNSFTSGRFKLLPLAYTAIATYLQRLRVDVAVAHVAPPDDQGNCSLGIASDLVPLVWARAGRRVAIVNASMPSMPRGPRISLAEADIVIDSEGPLICAPPMKLMDEFTAVANLVECGGQGRRRVAHCREIIRANRFDRPRGRRYNCYRIRHRLAARPRHG